MPQLDVITCNPRCWEKEAGGFGFLVNLSSIRRLESFLATFWLISKQTTNHINKQIRSPLGLLQYLNISQQHYKANDTISLLLNILKMAIKDLQLLTNETEFPTCMLEFSKKEKKTKKKSIQKWNFGKVLEQANSLTIRNKFNLLL